MRRLDCFIVWFATPLAAIAQPFLIEGLVRDEQSGQPIGGARVYARGGGLRFHLEQPAAVTGPDGRFRFEVEKPTAYLMSAMADGYLSGPDRLRLDMLAQVTAKQRTAQVFLYLARAGALSGRVVDADTGTPIGNLEVQASAVRWEYGRRVLERPDRAVVTGRDGMFRIEPLRSGEHALLLRPKDEAVSMEAAADPLDAPGLSGYGLDQSTTFHLDYGADLRLPDIRLSKRPLYRIRGWLEEAGCENTNSYRLSLLQVFGPSHMLPVAAAKLACKSPFSVRSVWPGEFQMIAHADVPASLDRATADARFTLSADTELRLSPAAPVSILGTVRYPETFPMEAKTRTELGIVTIGGPGNARVRYEQPLTGFEVLGFPGSTYRLTMGGLAPPYYVATVLHNGAEAPGSTFEPGSQPAGQTLEVVISARAARLHGQVVEKEKPIPRASVVLLAEPIRYRSDFPVHWTVTADMEGRFRFPGLAPGAYLLLAVPEFGWRELHKPGVLEALGGSAKQVRLLPETSTERTIEVTWVGR